MITQVTGIHHATAIAGQPRRNVNSYVGLPVLHKLPPWLESRRNELEETLPTLDVPTGGRE